MSALSDALPFDKMRFFRLYIRFSFRTAGTEPDRRKVKKEPHDGEEKILCR